MNRTLKINVKTSLTIVLFLYLGLLILPVQALNAQVKRNLQTTKLPNSTKKPLLSNSSKDTSMALQNDSMRIKTDTLKMSKDSIDAPIKYQAEDSGVLIVSTKEFYLYGKAKVDYSDLKLDAATIKYEQKTQMVKAYGALDTTGNPMSKPQFVQGEMKSVSDTIFYNMKTGKGLTKNTFFQEGEIYVNAADLKKISATEIFARRARFTTCNLDTPHFNFRTSRMKIINNKMGIAGPSFPEFEGVPMPIGLPFGIFPLTKGRSAGILPPQFTASPDFGLGFEGLGYYYVVNDNVDITARTNIYSFGGWNLNINSKYIKRYSYTGNLNITFQNTKTLNRSTTSKDEFNNLRSFMINWSHSRDSRARPGTSFSANVNFGSSRFNQTLLNNPFANFQNQLSSSISYSKDWKGKYNLSLNLNHSQNNNLRLVNLNLPTVNFNMVTFYPFQQKEQVGSGKWYDKIGIGYSGNFQNQISFYDTAFNIKRLLDTLQYGAQHSVPITLSLPSLGPITLAPGVSYNERWYGQRVFRNWNNTKGKVDTTIQKGFYTAREMSFGISANTRIFGTYKFKPSSNLIAIRHEIRPNISVNYKPDFASKYHYNFQVDSTGRRVRGSQFDGAVNGSFGEGIFGGMGFGIDNLLEMKVKNKTDSADKAGKKVKLIDGFGFNSSYNFLADSFQLGDFTFYARSTLFEKINITAGASLSPYRVDSKGFPINQILFDPATFKFGRITTGNIAISTSFKSKSKDGKAEKEATTMPIDPFMTPDEQQRQLQFARANPAEFTDFNIPWNISISYSFRFDRVIAPDYSGFVTRTFSAFNFNGDFSLTDKWKVGATGFYDISRGNLQQLSTFITREMHCWQLSINVNPVGLFRSFNITVSPKSGILRDLRINRSRTFSN
jgi:LPS-assembly protein